MTPKDEAPAETAILIPEGGHAKRTKSPRYDLYRVNASGNLEPLATDVAAATRKEAIKKQDDPWGTFAVARTGELKVLTRNKVVAEADDWA